MFILQLYSGQKTSLGDFVYRIERPAKGLSSLKDIEVLNLDLLAITEPDLLIEVPLLILHHLSDPDLLPLIAERKARGKPTIYEIADNFRASHLHRKEARRTGPPDYHLVMQEIIRRCDAVQTTSMALEDRYRELNPNFFIFQTSVIAKLGKISPSTSGFRYASRQRSSANSLSMIESWSECVPSATIASVERPTTSLM